MVFINGAPGTGKSTLAQRLAEATPMALALDVDVVKHSLGQWRADPTAAGNHARRLALAMAEQHLRAGYDVVVGQYVARPRFVERLQDLAGRTGAAFFEFVLVVDHDTLVSRLEGRAARPARPEHPVNSRLVGPADVPQLLRSMDDVRTWRPTAVPVDASGTLDATVDRLRRHLAAGT